MHRPLERRIWPIRAACWNRINSLATELCNATDWIDEQLDGGVAAAGSLVGEGKDCMVELHHTSLAKQNKPRKIPLTCD